MTLTVKFISQTSWLYTIYRNDVMTSFQLYNAFTTQRWSQGFCSNTHFVECLPTVCKLSILYMSTFVRGMGDEGKREQWG